MILKESDNWDMMCHINILFDTFGGTRKLNLLCSQIRRLLSRIWPWGIFSLSLDYLRLWIFPKHGEETRVDYHISTRQHWTSQWNRRAGWFVFRRNIWFESQPCCPVTWLKFCVAFVSFCRLMLGQWLQRVYERLLPNVRALNIAIILFYAAVL
jgi:hypothetical protein